MIFVLAGLAVLIFFVSTSGSVASVTEPFVEIADPLLDPVSIKPVTPKKDSSILPVAEDPELVTSVTRAPRPVIDKETLTRPARPVLEKEPVSTSGRVIPVIPVISPFVEEEPEEEPLLEPFTITPRPARKVDSITPVEKEPELVPLVIKAPRPVLDKKPVSTFLER